MRTHQEQFVDLQNELIKGMRKIKDNQEGFSPILLRGEEGKTLYNLCHLIAHPKTDKGPDLSKYAGSLLFEGTPVRCW